MDVRDGMHVLHSYSGEEYVVLYAHTKLKMNNSWGNPGIVIYANKHTGERYARFTPDFVLNFHEAPRPL